MEWKVLSSEYLFNEPWLTIRKDRCQLPNGHIVPAFYVNEYPDWVNVFALTEEGQVVMVKQYRHGIREISIELPGGVIDEGETPEEAARRELMEETMLAIRQGRSDIDPYGATSPVECFAVVSEYFFEQPEMFRSNHPEWYGLMQRVFMRRTN